MQPSQTSRQTLCSVFSPVSAPSLHSRTSPPAPHSQDAQVLCPPLPPPASSTPARLCVLAIPMPCLMS